MFNMTLSIYNKAQMVPDNNIHIKQRDMRITRQRNYKIASKQKQTCFHRLRLVSKGHSAGCR